MEPSQIIELVGQLCGVLIIIVNPLATQFPKRWQIMVMFCIINFLSVINQLCVGNGFASAFGSGLAVIHCTINAVKAKKEIETKYAERITSRLFGEYYPLVFTGVDIRKQKI